MAHVASRKRLVWTLLGGVAVWAAWLPASAYACQDAGPPLFDYSCVDGGVGVAIACATHADCPSGLSCAAQGWCSCAPCAVEDCSADGGGCRCAHGMPDAGPGCAYVWRPEECLASGQLIDAHWETVCPDAGTAGSDAGVAEMDASFDVGTVAPAPSGGCAVAGHAGDGRTPVLALVIAGLALGRRRARGGSAASLTSGREARPSRAA